MVCPKVLKYLPPIHKKYLLCGVICVFVLDFFGAFTHLFEEDFDENFQYPYYGDIGKYVLQLSTGIKPDVPPINVYNFSYLYSNSYKCKDSRNLRLVYIIKSSLENFERRKVIRRTWGYEKRFSDVKIFTIFVLGTSLKAEYQVSIDREINAYKDIIQIDFIDSYYNNTLKTMSAFKWVTEYCPHSRFYFFSDDDMYISTKNVLRFLRNPTQYPGYLEMPPLQEQNTELLKDIKYKIRHSYNYDLPPNITLYAGFVFVSSPLRHKSSKWYVSLKEYKYNMWPPYIPAGAYVVSRDALFKLYYTSFYTKHFRFDDIFLGLVSLKAGIQPFHCDQFSFYKKKYNLLNYKYLISSHGYDNPEELEFIWNQQKEAGNV
ncbi:hypothetical protein RUM43_008871 [Polyplax serrata]|uniref:Hexosyltransferase n=1 Tax=Polyplax serrata TaxID=468196 RepID=A0AAN8P6N0_POLSC